jgi:hypothetical protein
MPNSGQWIAEIPAVPRAKPYGAEWRNAWNSGL